jgi:hypothetical protein
VIRLSGIATLSDGTSVRFAGGPREFAAWERYALLHGLPPGQNAAGDAAGLTMTWYLAYACVTKGEAERPAFDAWLDTLVGIADMEIELPPPTQAAASDTPSDGSPLLPESLPLSSGTPTRATSQPSRPS